MGDAAEVRLQTGYRVIRQITAPGESPWPGALTSEPTGQTVLAVDARSLGDRWRGWSADPEGHVLAPVDVFRRPGGHDVLLPVCTERLADFLDRRGGLSLSTGEAVTLAVSLLRGWAELQDGDVPGMWWLTEAGRPVFATDTGSDTVADQTAGLLKRIAEQVPPMTEVASEVSDAWAKGRRGRVWERAEAALFALAEPTPLATTTFGPQRVRDRLPPDADGARDTEDPPPTPWPFALSRYLDAEWTDLISRATTGVWRAVRTPRTGRRRPWLIAGGLAGAILAGGLLLPAQDADTATAGDATPSPAPGPSPSPVEPPEPPADVTPPGHAEAPPTTGPADLVAVAGSLLSARAACGSEGACLADVLEKADASFPAGTVDLPAPERTLTLLDDFGGAAVLRVESVAGDRSPQLAVVVQVDGRWLLRDVYDIAEQ